MNSRKNPSLALSFLVAFCLTLSLTGCASLFRRGDANENGAKTAEKGSHSYSSTEEEPSESELLKDKKIQSLEATVSTLNSRIQELEGKLQATQNRPALNSRLAKTDLDGKSSRQNLTTPIASVALSDPGAGFVNDANVRAFQQGKILFDQEKYPEAILAFSAFIERNEKHVLASTAQYYIAESYFLENDYAVADQEFQKLAVRYPNSARISHALVRLAECSEKMGKADEARRYRLQIDGLYAKSPAVKTSTGSALRESMTATTPVAVPAPAQESNPPTPIATAPDTRDVAPDFHSPTLPIEKPTAPTAPRIEGSDLDAPPGAEN